jgi:hypothetical protein
MQPHDTHPFRAAFRNWRGLFIGAPIVCATIPLVCIPGAEWAAVAPNGTETGLWFVMFLVFPMLAAVPGFFMGLIGLLFRRLRLYGALLAVCSLTFFISFIAALRIGEAIRMREFARLAELSKPLITAIRAYDQKHGRPPESLGTLVPEFLGRVPSTGMGAYPDYRYSIPTNGYEGNPWVLYVFTPSGGINFDQFMYFPLTNYPKRGYGGWLEQIGDWAYVHE